MKANGTGRWAVAASAAAMVLAVQAMGQAANAPKAGDAPVAAMAQAAANAPAAPVAANAPAIAAVSAATRTETLAEVQGHQRVIVVSLEDRKLALVEDGQVKKVYTVAVGKPSTPSPVGTFTIERRVKNPVYHHEGKTVEPGPTNPVGSRWMGLSIKGYGIHGTNMPKSIGKAASHGCIRMGKADLEDLFEQVKVGDTVELIGQRNEETAELFGEAKPGEPVVVASAAEVPATGATTDSGVEGNGNN